MSNFYFIQKYFPWIFENYDNYIQRKIPTDKQKTYLTLEYISGEKINLTASVKYLGVHPNTHMEHLSAYTYTETQLSSWSVKGIIHLSLF